MTYTSSLRRQLRRLRRFLGRPWSDQWLFLQAFLALGLARLTINTMPFARLVGHLGVQNAESPAEVPPAHLEHARRIGWAVRAASRLTPWKSSCFPQAIAAKYLLRRRGIASTLYLGAAFRTRSELEAHAWLRCGSLYVTGGPGQTHFGTLGRFG